MTQIFDILRLLAESKQTYFFKALFEWHLGHQLSEITRTSIWKTIMQKNLENGVVIITFQRQSCVFQSI